MRYSFLYLHVYFIELYTHCQLVVHPKGELRKSGIDFTEICPDGNLFVEHGIEIWIRGLFCDDYIMIFHEPPCEGHHFDSVRRKTYSEEGRAAAMLL
jgi:hypothetical protein